MEHLDVKSQELFAHYRAIAAKLKKRFMKKPNAREASKDYEKLANALKNEDNPQYAALCFSAMARCDQMMGDSSGEAEAWANAGRQFFQAEDVLFTAKQATYRECLEAGVQCFLLAIDVHERQNNKVLAAMYCLELAHKLKYFQQFHEALRIFQRASDLQTDKPECQLRTLEEVVSCKIRLREYDGALMTLTSIVNEVQGKDGPYALIQMHCEVSQLLLLLMLQVPQKHMKVEHSMLMKRFSQDLLDADVLCGGVGMSTDLFISLQSLTIAVQKKDYSEIETIRPYLWKLLEPEQQHLLHLLMDVHCLHRHTLL